MQQPSDARVVIGNMPLEVAAAPPAPERKMVLGTTEALGSFLILGGMGDAQTPSAAKQLYEQASAVAIPVNLIADHVAEIEVGLKVGNTITLDAPVLEFLRRPSPDFSQKQFLGTITKDFLITGEYAAVANGTTRLQSLYPIGPEYLSAVQGPGNDAPAEWTITGNTLTGTYRATPSVSSMKRRYLNKNAAGNELHVTRAYSTRNNSMLRGQSPLVSAAKEARQAVLGMEHNVSLLQNGGRVSLVFHFEENMDQQDFEATAEKLMERFGGQNLGGIGVTAGGKMTVEEFGKTPKDMDWANLYGMSEKTLAKVYHVPLPLVSDQRMTQNNYETAVLALYDDAVLPTMGMVLDGLSKILLPWFKLDPRKASLVPYQDSVTALVQRRNTELLKLAQLGIFTDNELRAMVGREPYEGGDQVYKPATMVPVGSDLFTSDNAPEVVEPVLGGSSNRED